MSTKLEALKITEVSAVDDPANALPGYMVCKSRDGTIPILVRALLTRRSPRLSTPTTTTR